MHPHPLDTSLTRRKKPTPLTTVLYVAVRRCAEDGHEWLDTATASGARDWVQTQAAQTDALIPSWARMNPVVRIATARMTEEEPA